MDLNLLKLLLCFGIPASINMIIVLLKEISWILVCLTAVRRKGMFSSTMYCLKR